MNLQRLIYDGRENQFIFIYFLLQNMAKYKTTLNKLRYLPGQTHPPKPIWVIGK